VLMTAIVGFITITYVLTGKPFDSEVKIRIPWAPVARPRSSASR
jgi:hypothetical protein